MGIVDFIERYERKNHESFWDAWNSKDFPCIEILSDGSFFTYNFDDKFFYLGPTCGNFKEIYDIVKEMCFTLGLFKVVMWTKRHPKAWTRWRGEIVSETNYTDGRPSVYQIEWEVPWEAKLRSINVS